MLSTDLGLFVNANGYVAVIASSLVPARPILTSYQQ